MEARGGTDVQVVRYTQTRCVVCRPGSLIPIPGFFPCILPFIVLASITQLWPSRSTDNTLFAFGSTACPLSPVVNRVSLHLSLVSQQSVGDCRGQRGTSLLPCISSFPKSVPILLIVVVAVEAISLFTSRFLCFTWNSWYPSSFSLVTCLSFCLIAIFFLSFFLNHQ